MARPAASFVCQDCGAAHRKWAGRCDSCGAWNTIVEEVAAAPPPKGLGHDRGVVVPFAGLEGSLASVARRASGIEEFDRVCGGGLVPGSAILVGGDPGIGKSTLLLQVVATLASQATCIYISGEESVEQVRLRAGRLGLAETPVRLAAATSVRDITTSIETIEMPGVVVVDSIQTMFVDTLESAPGTVAQVRTSAQELIRQAKRRGFTLILVGHVTKEGTIAGPRVLEHMVDTVLYFEGEREHQFRLLRTIKNRFGPTDEIGVFEMTDRGLVQVGNPSALFLAERHGEVSGAVVFAGIEGTRPVLVEIQALVAPSSLATPRRTVVGWDSGRLAMVLAVLEARAGLSLAGRDVYLNVAGGLRIGEPAADLAVAAALASAAADVPAPADAVFFGEVGLSGEIRGVSQAAQRLKEAEKLGFRRAFVPQRKRSGAHRGTAGGEPSALRTCEIVRLADLLEYLGTDASDGAFASSRRRGRPHSRERGA